MISSFPNSPMQLVFIKETKILGLKVRFYEDLHGNFFARWGVTMPNGRDAMRLTLWPHTPDCLKDQYR